MTRVHDCTAPAGARSPVLTTVAPMRMQMGVSPEEKKGEDDSKGRATILQAT